MTRERKTGSRWSIAKRLLAAAIVATLGMVILEVGSGRAMAEEGKDGKAAPAAAQAAPKPQVAYVVIGTEPLTLTTELPARTSAFLVAEVRPQVSGIVQKRLFNEGSQVKAGEVLYEIDPAPFQASVDIAEANLEVAKRTAERARAALEASEANVKQQEATSELAELNRERAEDLVVDGAVSASDRDAAVTNSDVARAALEAARAQIESDRSALAVAEASIKQAEASLKAARIELNYTKIKAPIFGWIGKSNVTVGAMATAYQGIAFATIQQLDPVYVDAPQSNASRLQLLRNMQAGRIKSSEADATDVELLFEDGTPYNTAGTLKFSDVTVEPSTGSFIFRMTFPNPDNLLLPGMYVRAVVEEGMMDKAILVPQQGVSRDRRGDPYVLLVGEDGTVVQRPIVIDRAVGNRWLVDSGLSVGDRVIVEGALRARPGTPVNAVPFESSTAPATETKG
ncbi:efflux RND transporter periplasmic adaptor subunit [bacterium]|nr:efflux RND transporter periplasmic adaptor subunit [bacterium]